MHACQYVFNVTLCEQLLPYYFGDDSHAWQFIQLTLSARGPSLHVCIYRRQILTYYKEGRRKLKKIFGLHSSAYGKVFQRCDTF